MEYIYAALTLHKAGKEVSEDNVKKVLEAAGVAVDDGRIKALIAALDGVDIDEAVKSAAPVAAAPAAAPAEGGDAPAAEAKPEKSAEEEKKEEEQAAAGLGALFG